MQTLVEIHDLSVEYKSSVKEIKALHDVSLSVQPSQIIAIVGESGSGKSTLGLAIINLLQKPPAVVDSGQILFDGEDLLKVNEKQMAGLRGTRISMIFQEPMSSLDPVYTVADLISEAIAVREKRTAPGHYGPFQSVNPELRKGTDGGLSRMVGIQLPNRRRGFTYSGEMVDVLKRVQIADPERVLRKYPHELSGGMAQRVMIAQALVQKPALLIADEPTSALDVTTQAQVLKLMQDLRDEIGSSILFITHDLAVAAQIADRVAVMYAGELVELADVGEIFDEPLHPYTEGLLNSIPRRYRDEGKLQGIPGDVPDLRSPPPGCKFHPRCKYAFERCRIERPELIAVNQNHRAACFLRYQK